MSANLRFLIAVAFAVFAGEAFASDPTGIATFFGILLYAALSAIFGTSALLIGAFFDPKASQKSPPLWLFFILSIIAVPAVFLGFYPVIDSIHLLQKPGEHGPAYAALSLFLLFIGLYAFHIYIFFSKHKT